MSYNYMDSWKKSKQKNDFSSLQNDQGLDPHSAELLRQSQEAAIQRQKFANSGSKADLVGTEATTVTPDAKYGGALQGAGTMVAKSGAGGPLMDTASMGLSGAGVGAMAGGLPGAAIGAGVGASIGLVGGLAKARMEKKKRAAEAKQQSLMQIANIEQQRGTMQQSAIANIMAALKGSFGGI